MIHTYRITIGIITRHKKPNKSSPYVMGYSVCNISCHAYILLFKQGLHEYIFIAFLVESYCLSTHTIRSDFYGTEPGAGEVFSRDVADKR